MAEYGTPLPLAVQLYTFRDPDRFGGAGLGLDPITLEAIAGAGFLGVETVDVPGGDAGAARRVLADVGLAVTSSHTWTDTRDTVAFRRAADAVAELGSTRIIVSAGADELRDGGVALIERLAHLADLASDCGLRLGIHNHDGEMAVVDGRRIVERLAFDLGGAVDVQLDIFWAMVGGADPADLIVRLGERVVSLHLKDGDALPRSASGDVPFLNVPVGTGSVDPGPAVAAAERAGSVEWLIVEFDHVEGSAIDAARASLANLVERGLGRARPS